MNQSSGVTGQRFIAFLVTVLSLNSTLALATYLNATPELAMHVIEWESIVGGVLILGRTGVHMAEAWASRFKQPQETK